MSGPSSVLEIEVFRESLSRYFLTAPNALYRGEAMYEGLTGRARCLLAALLSLPSGYRTSRPKIEKFLDECGREAVDKVLAELRARGFLAQTRLNGGGGKFVWRWQVRMFPEGMSVPAALAWLERAALFPGQTMPGISGDGGPAPGDDEDVSAGQTMPGISGDGEDGINRAPAISAGGTMPGIPGHGEPGHGRPGPGEPDAIEGTAFDFEKELTPPLTDSGTVAPGEPAATGGGEEDQAESPDRLTEIVEDIAAIRRGGWQPADVRAALLAAKDRGRDPAHAVRALIALAEDVRGVRYEHTGHPSRLNAFDGRWWADTADRPKPSPRARRDRCYRHGVLGKPCTPCAAEKAAQKAAPPPLAAQVAAELIRENVAQACATVRARHARRRNEAAPVGQRFAGEITTVLTPTLTSNAIDR